MNEWLPIESAPTDGTKFLAWRRGEVASAYRVTRDDCEMWVFGGASAAVDTWPEIKPSHWMPLPEDPKTKRYEAETKLERDYETFGFYRQPGE